MARKPLALALSLLAVALTAADKPAAATPPLLDAAVLNWLAGKDDWAFTQHMRAFDDDGKVKEELVSRYDPSLPDNQRWRLLEWNGKQPTPSKRAAWEKSRNSKPRKHANKPLDELFELGSARLERASGDQVVYQVPVKQSAARLIQVEKLDIEVAVGRKSQVIERVTAGLHEPMRVALGLATVVGLELDVRFDPDEGKAGPASPDAPKGTARASVSKFGDLIEYEWSDFRRVTAFPTSRK